MNQQAIFGLSFALALLDAIQKQEPATHTRRYRQIDKCMAEINRTIDLYPGEIDREVFDKAVSVFNKLEEEVNNGE